MPFISSNEAKNGHFMSGEATKNMWHIHDKNLNFLLFFCIDGTILSVHKFFVLYDVIHVCT